MKQIAVLILLLLSLNLFGQTIYIQRHLFDRNSGYGYNPKGGLIQATDGKLYGLTNRTKLGSGSIGTIFCFDLNTKVINKLYEFGGLSSNGAWPAALSSNALTQTNGTKLYGKTGFGSFTGIIFSFDISNNTYSALHQFPNSNEGVDTTNALTKGLDGKLYGTNSYGGGGTFDDRGIIFSFNPLTNAYTKLYNFDEVNGKNPTGNLVQATNGKFYGTTQKGGMNNQGVIFSFDPINNSYAKLYDFDGINGSYPMSSFIQANDGKLYSTTNIGGLNSKGIIFSFDPATNIYTKLYDFSDNEGANPVSAFIQANDGKLYSMTKKGGLNNRGVIYNFDIVSNIYTKLFDFSGSDGGNPTGSLIQLSNGRFYGLTEGGGMGGGVLFEFFITQFYYARTDGNDSNDGKTNSPSGAKKTIQATIDAVSDGGVIVIVGDAFFDENVVINKNITIKTIGNVSVKNITVGGGKVVDLQSPLGITGLLKLDQSLDPTPTGFISNGNLTLLSTATTTAMIDNAGGEVTGNVTYQRYLGDYSYRTSVQGYSYFSSPTSGTKISDFSDNIPVVLNPAYDFVSAYSGAFPNFFRYNESKVVSSPANFNVFEKGWESPAALTENLQVGRGYILNLNTNTLIDFKGTLNNGDINIPITKGIASNSGWNLVGNPYPSSLDWEKVWDLNKTKVKSTILRRIALTPFGGTWAYYTAGVGGLNAQNGGTQNIAVGQGFFLEKINQGNDNLVLNNGMRSYSQTQFFRTEEDQESKTQGVVKVKLTSQKWSDETMIYFKRGASEKYDEGMEVPKAQYNSSPAPNLFTSINGKRVAFNAQSIENLPKEIPLHFMAASGGQHEISLSELRNFKENTPIYLEDKRLNVTHDLSQKAYSFTANAGTDTARFVLKFEVAFAQQIPDESLTIYPNPAGNELKIKIDSKLRGKLQIRLLDMLGRELKSQSFEKVFTQEEFKINLNEVNKGTYLIEVQDDKGKQVRKVVKE